MVASTGSPPAHRGSGRRVSFGGRRAGKVPGKGVLSFSRLQILEGILQGGEGGDRPANAGLCFLRTAQTTFQWSPVFNGTAVVSLPTTAVWGTFREVVRSCFYLFVPRGMASQLTGIHQKIYYKGRWEPRPDVTDPNTFEIQLFFTRFWFAFWLLGVVNPKCIPLLCRFLAFLGSLIFDLSSQEWIKWFFFSTRMGCKLGA